MSIREISLDIKTEKQINVPTVYTLNDELPSHLVLQLIQYSNSDPLILAYTSDKERFKDEESYSRWLEKDRLVYSLVNEEKTELLGIVWFRRKPLPTQGFEFTEIIKPGSYNITVAKRLYGELRNKGVAKKLMKMVFSEYIRTITQTGERNGLWSETSASNTSNINVNESLGFRRITGPNAENKILMIVSYQNLKRTL